MGCIVYFADVTGLVESLIERLIEGLVEGPIEHITDLVYNICN